MNLIFVTQARFIKDGKGEIYALDSAYNSILWERYLTSFSHLYVMARVKNDSAFKGSISKLSSGKKISFLELPYYVGPFEYLKKYLSLKISIKKHISNISGAYICRVPGKIGDMVINELTGKKKSYAVEVVGDPDAVFAPGTIDHPLRALFRKRAVKLLTKNVLNAKAALYVTKSKLQQKYPAKDDAYTTYASNVKLDDRLIAKSSKKWTDKKNVNILSIGSLEQMYKAPDTAIEAMEQLKKERPDLNFKLKWLGDGQFKSQMKNYVTEINLEQEVSFKGNVSKTEVFKCLEESDIFILVSRTEGLPRALIEAMAAGLPCIGTNVGGIPELLEEKVLIEKDNPDMLANKIQDLLSNKQLYDYQAERNHSEAHKYKESVLQKRRTEFYGYIKNNL